MPDEAQFRRSDLINLVLKDLREFRDNCNYEQEYAVDENIKFFEAAVDKRDG